MTPVHGDPTYRPSSRFSSFTGLFEGKGTGKGLDSCYSDAYVSQTRNQQRFTILVVVADWHEPQRIMWPTIARANGQLDPRCS